jgi:hypothetical protein
MEKAKYNVAKKGNKWSKKKEFVWHLKCHPKISEKKGTCTKGRKLRWKSQTGTTLSQKQKPNIFMANWRKLSLAHTFPSVPALGSSRRRLQIGSA